MEIPTKTIIKELTKGLLGSSSKKVCTDESRNEYGTLIQSTLISEFLADETKTIPTKKLCARIKELFDYELYPENYKKAKHNVTPDEMAEKIRRYTVGLLSCDLTDTKLTDTISIKIAEELIGYILMAVENEEKIPIEALRKNIKDKYSKTPDSFISFANLINYQGEFKNNYYSLIDRTAYVRDAARQFYSLYSDEQTIDNHVETDADLALSIIEEIKDSFLSILKADKYDDIPNTFRNKYESVKLPNTYQDTMLEHSNTQSIITVLSSGYKKSDAPKYINCVLELFGKRWNETLSAESKKLLDSAKDKIGNAIYDPKKYNTYLWKISFSNKISQRYNRSDLDIKYLYYYIKESVVHFKYQPHRYDLGINKLQPIYDSLNKEISNIYKPIDSFVENEITYYLSGKYLLSEPNEKFYEKLKTYSPNELLVGYEGGLIWFEKLICNILNTLKAMQKIESKLDSGKIFY